MKKLSRSENDKLVSGVCGGIGEYFDVDPTLIRLLFILVLLINAITSAFSSLIAGVIVYVMAWLIIPENFSKPKETQKGAGKAKK